MSTAHLSGGTLEQVQLRPTPEVPLWRLYGLRGAYLLLFVGLGIQVWPGILFDHGAWDLMEGVVQCMLGAISILALLGLRYPLRMLPLLLFEIAWKGLWVGVVATPKMMSGQMDDATASTFTACLLVVIFLIVIPWRYVGATFIRARGDRWL